MLWGDVFLYMTGAWYSALPPTDTPRCKEISEETLYCQNPLQDAQSVYERSEHSLPRTQPFRKSWEGGVGREPRPPGYLRRLEEGAQEEPDKSIASLLPGSSPPPGLLPSPPPRAPPQHLDQVNLGWIRHDFGGCMQSMGVRNTTLAHGEQHCMSKAGWSGSSP